MPLVQKRTAMVGSECLVDPLAIQESMIEDGHHGIAVAGDAAIDVHGR